MSLEKNKMETKLDHRTRIAEIFETHEKPDDYNVIAVLESHVEAEEAIKKLQLSGIDLKECSMVGKENLKGEHVVGYYYVGDRIAYWGEKRAFWGGLWSLLGGSAFFMIPGIGPTLVGGPFVGAIVRALKGAMVVEGLSALGGGFFNIGIPQLSINAYEVAVKGDHFVAIVHGNSVEVAKAKTVLESSAHQEKSAFA